MKTKTVNLDDLTRAILMRSRIEGNNLFLPEQLARPDYERVAKAIKAAGGKWHRQSGAHVFPQDVRKTLNIGEDTVEVVNVQQTYQFFPTPPDIAQQMAIAADLQTGQRVLEPSAGEGALIEAAGEQTDWEIKITAVEINPLCADKIMARYAGTKANLVLIRGDFTEQTELGQFDRILMNPPFTGGQGVAHIKRAIEYLAPGGRLVALICDGPREREALQDLASCWSTLPAGSFKQSGTMINIAMLTINTPKAVGGGRNTPGIKDTPKKARKAKATAGPLPAPTPGARALLAKLQALAERGVNGEKDAAQAKLARLLKRYNWTIPDPQGPDIFAGHFAGASEAAPIMRFEACDWDIANAVKWSIEATTGLRCLYRGGELFAQAAPSTANRLHDIAATVAASFGQLWRQFAQAPGANRLDRANFIMGLNDGMLDLERKGELLPSRATVEKVKRARKRDLAAPAGLALHPYTVAAHLGRQVRFAVPLEDLAGQLEKAVKGEIERQ